MMEKIRTFGYLCVCHFWFHVSVVMLATFAAFIVFLFGDGSNFANFGRFICTFEAVLIALDAAATSVYWWFVNIWVYAK